VKTTAIEMNEGFEFHFHLPKEGLALRSVELEDGVPELWFTASPKIPTITEEDVAIACRLASEEKRPEFFFIAIPPGHPFCGRQYKFYNPQWLRGTSVGNDLSEADWAMKCLSIGARSNESKSVFWSWSKTSELEGSATWLDFPVDAKPSGASIIMSCESVTVQEDAESLVFLEEPKMKIDDQGNSLYSKYITKMYPSIAYYDEPLFLKMQELPKLMLAAEWLKGKGVKMNQKWMMLHTAKPQGHDCEVRRPSSGVLGRKKPPRAMLPKPTHIEVPTKDVTVKTREAEQYRYLAKCGVSRCYGWQDNCSGEIVMFTDDGKPLLKQQSMRTVLTRKHSLAVGELPLPTIQFLINFPLPPNVSTTDITEMEEKICKRLPPNSNEELSDPQLAPMVVNLTLAKTVSEKSIEPKKTEVLQLCPSLTPPHIKITTSIRASVNDYDKLYGGYADPNGSLGRMKDGKPIVPDVQSWSELYSETVPWPHTWQMPYIGVGQPAASGGVSTQSIPVIKTPVTSPKREAERSKTEWARQYGRCKDQLAVRAQHGLPPQGMPYINKTFSCGSWIEI